MEVNEKNKSFWIGLVDYRLVVVLFWSVPPRGCHGARVADLGSSRRGSPVHSPTRVLLLATRPPARNV